MCDKVEASQSGNVKEDQVLGGVTSGVKILREQLEAGLSRGLHGKTSDAVRNNNKDLQVGYWNLTVAVPVLF